MKIAKIISKQKISLFKTIFPKSSTSKPTFNQLKDNISELIIENENDFRI